MINHKYTIKKIENRDDEVVILEIGPKNGGPVFNFKPGQYVMISYRNSENGRVKDRHAFSIASSPSQKDHIRLGIKIMGNFTQGLLKLKEADEIFVSRPFGDFIFDEDKHRDLVLFAGGIGITPFMSILDYAHREKLANKFTLLCSNKTLDKSLFLEEIKQMEQSNKNLKTLFSVTEEKIPDGKDLEGVISGRVNKNIIRDFVGDIKDKIFFICGPVPFMNTVKQNLFDLGVNQSQIEMEEFSMIPDVGFWANLKNVFYAVGASAALILLPFYLIYSSDKKLFGISDAMANNQLQTQGQIKTQNQSLPANNSSDSGTASANVIADIKKKVIDPATKSSIKPTDSPNFHTPAASALAVVMIETPKPTTSASIVSENQANINQINQVSAPAPTTSASSVAISNVAQNQSQTTNTSVPSPITSASNIPTSSPVVVLSNNDATNTTSVIQTNQPAPTTLASAVSAAASTSIVSPTNSSVIVPAPSYSRHFQRDYERGGDD